MIGPPWTRGEGEKPTGTVNMGSWTANVYEPKDKKKSISILDFLKNKTIFMLIISIIILCFIFNKCN